MLMPKLYGLAHNPIYAKHKPFGEMTMQEYADWYCGLSNWVGIERFAILNAERRNDQSVPTVLRRR